MKNDYKWQIQKDCADGGVGKVYGNTMVSPKSGKQKQILVSTVSLEIQPWQS
jgi:hypothetical protein